MDILPFRTHLHRAFPNHCALCGQAQAQYLCRGCALDLPRLADACPICALPLQHPDAPCADCLLLPKPFSLSLCPYIYAHPLATLINRFKAQRHFAAGRYLVEPLVRCVNLAYEQLPDGIVAMPLFWRRRLWRGFSQAQFLAEIISAQTGIPLVAGVKKRRATEAQQGLQRQQRLHNLKNAFVVEADVRNQHILLVDDVMTTCASAISLSEVLLNAGARRVDVAVLARTPKL